LSRGRGDGGDFILAEDHGEPVKSLGVLSEEDDKMRKRAYKAVKQGFASYEEDFNTKSNVMPGDEWNVDRKTNFLHVPFKIETFPACGLFEKYWQEKFSDTRAVVEYDGEARFILKLDWEKLATLEGSSYAIVRRYRTQLLSVFFFLLLLWFGFIWNTTRREIKE
jgi:hypothetical protein